MNPAIPFRALRLAWGAAVLSTLVCAQTPTQQASAQDDFFEAKVRPVFVKNCQMCHNAKAKTAQLDLSSAGGFMTGGQSGPIAVPEHPESSRIIKAIGYVGAGRT